MNRLITLFVMLCFCLCSNASFELGKFMYEDSSLGGVCISLKSGEKLSGDLVIPSTVTYDGTTYTVTEVKANAFISTDITSVVVPETVKEVGKSAFAFCSSLVSASLKGTTNLGSDAFVQCISLQTAELSDELDYIRPGTFYYCSSLKNINVPKNLKQIGS